MKKFNSIALIISLFVTSSFGISVANAVPKKNNNKKVTVKNNKKKQVNSKKQTSKKQTSKKQTNVEKVNTNEIENKPVVENKKTSSSFSTSIVSNKLEKEDKKVYFKGTAGLGFEYQGYTGGDVNGLYNQLDSYARDNDLSRKAKNKFNYSPILSAGANGYLKLCRRFALLAGLEAQGRYPFSHRGEFFGFTEDRSQDVSFKFNEYFRLNAKGGFKIDLGKNIALETYGLVGVNMAEAKFSNKEIIEQGEDQYFVNSKTYKKMNFGLTTGVGLNIIFDRFTAGIEYRRSFNSMKGMYGVMPQNKFLMKTDSIMLKTGIQFG